MRNRNAILGLVCAAGLAAAGSTCAVSFSDYYQGKGGAGGAGTTTGGTPASNGATQPTTGSASPTASSTGATGGGGGGGTTSSTGGAGGGGSTSSTGGPVDRDWPNWKMPNGPYDVTNEGAPNLATYQDNGNGTVTDTVTGLMWQKAVDPGSYTQFNALMYCSTTLNAGAGLGGHTDWRLPSRIELASLVDFSVFSPSINSTSFPGTPSDGFWSATPVASAPSFAWYVIFYYGTTYSNGMTNANRVRCVR